MKLELIEPLRELFKDEVRALGRVLGRPGGDRRAPAVPRPRAGDPRASGRSTRSVSPIVRAADVIVQEEIRAADLYDSALAGVRRAAPGADGRRHGRRAHLRERRSRIRAVRSTDGMTADWARLPDDVLARISTRIINEVRGVNRVVYDISSKPPATIEWE